jgi:hypothetical protein
MDPFVAAALGSMGFARPSSNTSHCSTAAAILVANA